MNQICHIRCKYSWYFHTWSCSVRAAELTAVCWTISIILPLWPLWPNLCKLFWPTPGFPESFICNPFLIPTELSWHHDFSISHAAPIFALIVLSLLHFYYLLHILRIQIPLLVLLTSCSSDLVSARIKLVWFCLITHFSLNNTVYIYNPLFSFSLVFWSFLPPFVLIHFQLPLSLYIPLWAIFCHTGSLLHSSYVAPIILQNFLLSQNPLNLSSATYSIFNMCTVGIRGNLIAKKYTATTAEGHDWKIKKTIFTTYSQHLFLKLKYLV